MRDALNALVPLFGFMLLPVWIPLLAVSIGWVADVVRSRRPDDIATRIAAAKDRSHAARERRALTPAYEAG